MKSNPKIVMFGAGAIGATVGAWVGAHHDNLYFFDTGKVAEALKTKGITVYHEGEKDKAQTLKVKVIDDIAQAADADIVCVAVKNYSLDGVSKMIREKIGDNAVIIGFQNGIDNQSILPNHFSKVVYCVISYNAWLDEPGTAGFQKRGPLIIGTPDNKLQDEMKTIADIFGRGVETIITPHLQDAVRSKMIINLTNSLTTLVGHRFRDISSPAVFQILLTNLTFEGVQIMRAAGFKECRLGGMPSWLEITAGAKLPQFITKGMFEKNVSKMVISSMAQDILQRGGQTSELESLNGYFLKTAKEVGVKAPFNETIYELCKQEFAKPKFEPMDVKDVFAEVKKLMK
jgi:2-dehydropantoate 2-reductase